MFSSSSTTKPKPKPKRRSSVAGSASSSVPIAFDPKLMELARQIGANRFNALVQSRAGSTSTSTPTGPPLNPVSLSKATSLATPESSRSKAAKMPAEGKPTSKQKFVGETPPSKKGKSTSKRGKHPPDVAGKGNDAPADDDEEERKARKKQRKLEKKQAKRKAALEAEADMEVDELESPVKDNKKKKGKSEPERTDKEVKKRSKKSKKLDKGKGKEIVQDNPNESFSSAVNDHPSPPAKPIAEANHKSKSSSKRPRPSDFESGVAVSPVKSPRKKRKLANGSSAAVPSTQANTAVSAPARPAVNGLPSTATDLRDLEQLLVQTVNALRASPSYARESGVFGEGIVQLFQALVAKVASADNRQGAPPASNHNDDDLTTPEEDEHEYEQRRRLSQNSGRTPLNRTEAPVASTSASSTRPALTSTFASRPNAAPTADAPETEAEAATKARAAKAAKKLLKKERREKKHQKEVAAKAPSSPPEEQEVLSAALDETPLSSPDKSERMSKERSIRKRLGKLEKGALRSMSQSAGSSRQSSLAPTLTLPTAREEIVIKVSDSQAEEAERAAIRAAEASTESSASSPVEGAPLNHSTDPTIRFRGEHDEASENEIDQLASTPVLAQPSYPLRQAPRSTISAFSSEDDPEEIELSLRTHASPRKDRPLSLDLEVESEDESGSRTEDDDVEENHEEEDGDAGDNDGPEEQQDKGEEGDDEPPARPKIEHDGDAAMADAQAQDESPVEEDAVHPASPITDGAVTSPGQRQTVYPVNVPLPPSPSPPTPIRTIGHDDDYSDASSSSDVDDSDSSSSSTASNRAYRKPSRPSIGAVATSAFGSAASMRKNRVKRQSSPLKTSSLARTLSITGPEIDKDAEMEEDVDELLSQPVPKSAVQKLLQDAEKEEQRFEEPRGRSTSVSSEADTNTAEAVAEPSKEGAVEEQGIGGGEADAGSTQSLKDANGGLETTIAEPMEAVNLSDIGAQASSAPGTPLMMDTQASQLIRPDHHGDDSDESQNVPSIKSKSCLLEATQQTQRLPELVDHEGEESQKASQTILNGSSQVEKAVDAGTLDVPSLATPNGRLTRAASLLARTASPGPSATVTLAIAPSSKTSVSARPPSASQPLPTTSFRGHGRASSMRALSQLDEATPRRSMRHASPLTSQGSALSAKRVAVPALSWIRKCDDGENESEDDSSEDEDRKTIGTSTKPRKSLWN